MVAKLIALVLPLGLDTFAVSAALAAIGLDAGQRLRISVLFSSFEAGMPLVGLGLGAPLGAALGGAADYVAVGVLLAFGLYALLASEEAEEARLANFTSVHGPAVLLLGLSISLDELAIGFTLGLLRLPVAVVIGLIALQAFVMAQAGLRLGGRLSAGLRDGAERLAGLALVGLAAVLLAEKLV